MGKNIEIFTDSNLFGDDVVKLVKEYACPKCSILIYDANCTDPDVDLQSKVSEYGITSMPAIVLDGKIVPPEKLARGKFANMVHHIFQK
ncbi:hypothetical protein [Paenibacillus agaridevorans]|uniref:hypothetical protein n=1 Tax=Paenibacillus agaridevorans TaxID=171404 RepID=UPI001BE4AF8D|nr:hypothetical protein [Paenibacillus agaridevorans]